MKWEEPHKDGGWPKDMPSSYFDGSTDQIAWWAIQPLFKTLIARIEFLEQQVRSLTHKN